LGRIVIVQKFLVHGRPSIPLSPDTVVGLFNCRRVVLLFVAEHFVAVSVAVKKPLSPKINIFQNLSPEKTCRRVEKYCRQEKVVDGIGEGNSWNRKREDLDKQYLEACGIILTILESEPLTDVQQYMRSVDGNRKFLQISEAIRRKYYPNTNLEKAIIVKWISKSTDEFGIKIWFSLWQEAIDILELVDPNSILRNNELIRFMETGMSNREFKSIFETLKAGMIPNR